eukprot:TRINITY_DN9089_c0_g1_i1.p1 TRINITY_DN9089_c0_g1~~TRINITY_DN9089_c0_g1_i1.p1  ORF type:complete len:485 (+),score=66.29 TRINITY_DN9089_c0_g1_i1:143-1597(+)
MGVVSSKAAAGSGVYVRSSARNKDAVIVHRLPDRAPLPGAPLQLETSTLDCGKTVNSVTVSSDGKWVVVAAANDLLLYSGREAHTAGILGPLMKVPLGSRANGAAVLTAPDGGAVPVCCLQGSMMVTWWFTAEAAAAAGAAAQSGGGAASSVGAVDHSTIFRTRTDVIQNNVVVTDWGPRGLGPNAAGVASVGDTNCMRLWRLSGTQPQRAGYSGALGGGGDGTPPQKYSLHLCCEREFTSERASNVIGVSVSADGSLAMAFYRAHFSLFSVAPEAWTMDDVAAGASCITVLSFPDCGLEPYDMQLHRRLPLLAVLGRQRPASDGPGADSAARLDVVQVLSVNADSAVLVGDPLQHPEQQDPRDDDIHAPRSTVCWAVDGPALLLADKAYYAGSGGLAFAGRDLANPEETLADAGIGAEAVVDLQGMLPPPDDAEAVREYDAGPGLDIGVRSVGGDVVVVTVPADATVGDLTRAAAAALQGAAA